MGARAAGSCSEVGGAGLKVLRQSDHVAQTTYYSDKYDDEEFEYRQPARGQDRREF